MMKNKTGSLSVLVLIFYLVHVVFPLLYSADAARAYDGTGTPTDISSARQDPSRPDLAGLSAVSRDQGEDDASADPSGILLKKRRALSSSFKDLFSKASLQVSKISTVEFSFGTTGIPVATPVSIPICPNGFPFRHSGPSPPSA